MTDFDIFLTWIGNEMTGFSADEWGDRALDGVDNAEEWCEDHPEIDADELREVLAQFAGVLCS